MSTKQCTICGNEYLATTEYFYAQPRNKDGLKGQCKTCYKVKGRQWEKNNPDKVKAKVARRDKIKGNATARRWREHHPESVALATKKYRENNPDKTRLWHEQFATANPDYQKNYYQEHIEYKRKYHKAKRAEYRARKRNAPGRYTENDVRALFAEQNGKCAYCGKDLSKSFHVDHIQPLSRGGSNWPENLCLSCQFCNQSKKDLTLDEWRKKGTR